MKNPKKKHKAPTPPPAAGPAPKITPSVQPAATAKRAIRWDEVPPPSPRDRARIEHIHKALKRAWGRGNVVLPNANDFAKELKLTRQTIYGIIRKMELDYSMPIETLPGGAGYRYTEEVLSTPFCKFSESEVLAVYLSHEMLSAFHKVPLKKKARTTFRKIIEQTGDNLSFDSAMVEEAFSITPSRHPAYYHPKHFETCCRALLRREELVLDYNKAHGKGANVPELRRVQPLHLAFWEFSWYLVTWDLKEQDYRKYMLGRMLQVKETRVPFVRPKTFNARDYLRKNFGIYTGGEEEDVALEFSPAVSRLIKDRDWHDTQKFHPRDHGGVGLTMRVAVTPDLVAWIAGFLDDCRIIAPLDLQQDVARRQARASTGHHKGSGDW